MFEALFKKEKNVYKSKIESKIKMDVKMITFCCDLLADDIVQHSSGQSYSTGQEPNDQCSSEVLGDRHYLVNNLLTCIKN